MHTSGRRTRVKICGITRPEDGKIAAAAGADSIGLVFYPPSPRAVAVEQAKRIAQALPPFVTLTGLFVDARRDEVERVAAEVGLDLLQFHGSEDPDYCNAFGRSYLKAVRMRDDVDLLQQRERYAGAQALLLDAYRKGVPGGTGESFDWQRIPAGLAGEIVLAGGLTSANVEQAIRQVHPYAVDVSGGVEQEKGIKSPAKIEAFMRGVSRGDDG